MEFQEYLNKSVQCGCGKTHRCGIEDVVIEPGAVERLPDLLRKHAYEHICIVEDENTKKVLGDRVEELVRGTGCEVTRIVLPADHLLPDETAIGSVLTAVPACCDLLISVGSGTLNDLGRFVSYKMHIPFFIVGTAPSMDGFASNVAAMVTNRAKVTYPAQEPRVIVGDVKVMKEAPMALIAAGVGDVLGKCVCLTDWRISSLITGEYYCESVAELVGQSVEKVKHAAQTLSERRDEQCVEELMEGLVLSGIAMSYIGNSRPASGSEHHLSHFWEMYFLQNGEHGAYHGTKVGIGTVLCLKMYEWLGQEDIGELISRDYQFDRAAWERSIKEIYKTAAPAVTEIENETGKNSVENRQARMKKLAEHWNEIRAMIARLPKAEEIKALLEGLGAPVFPYQIDVTDEMVINSCVFAKELRNRTGLLQVLHDLGLDEAYGKRLLDEFIGK